MNPPFIISFDITNRCNLRCLHCYNDSGAQRCDMDASDIKTVVEKIIRLKPAEVCICGGEPLLSPHLFDIIGKLRPNVAKLMMVTNGFLMDEKTAKKLVAAGIDITQISLDGANNFQHDSFRGVSGAFNRAVSAVKTLKAAGMKSVNAAMILNKLNCRCVADFLPLCDSIGADTVHIMQMLPLGRGENAVRNLSLSDAEIFRFCRELTRLRPLYERKMLIKWNDPVGSSKFIFYRGKKLQSPFSLSVRSNGKVFADPYLPLEVGNILDDGFEENLPKRLVEMWNDAKTVAKMERLNTVYDFEDTL